ncbi:vesicle-mediated transport-related protein [Phaffia rhodozyma]|uniref:AP complex subunit beta n=1 Tax=Phaffia rhodozyma TaxID=264483 RepID=A0A0F7SUV4_PHARH|nr:vesicle-mediated transport-related protein [Phaffia rhodozyma]
MSASTSGSDAKFFTRGKIQELRMELQQSGDSGSTKKDKAWLKRKIVLKKVVANMTMGNDMSPLFPDVIQSMPIQVLEIKKMVYLFLINYGRFKPDDTSAAIPCFLADCEDRNPLIRALALRTMTSIPLPAMVSAVIDPLRHGLKDADPYVRKTAALSVAKLYSTPIGRQALDRSPAFISSLRDLLADSNPTVVANAVASLVEISERSDEIALRLNVTVAGKLVAALGECSEWGQIYILDSLLAYTPTNSLDAETLAERISVRLQHANSAVVLTTIKIMLYLMNYMDDKDTIRSLEKKMGPPLVTLLSSGPEVQYVALRNILLIIQRRPGILQNEVKVFFCKYNDPIYVKLAKLEIMYRLAREQNAHEVLEELKEYASEVDVDFVRKAVRSIGRLAIKIPSAADKCISGLLLLIETKISYVTQEAVVVIKDIFRRYPNQYESIIGTLCENLDVLDEPEAKAAMIWIVGQYADRIENSDELLEDWVFTFVEEPAEVQLALLTATVKLFIRRPVAGQELLPKVLKLATEEAENPDLRDRGFFYWRLLSTDPTGARDIVLAEKPPISTETDRMDRGLLDQLLMHTGTLSSIYHKSPQTFIRTAKAKYLSDSPAMNPTTRKHLQSANGFSAVLPLPSNSSSLPSIPSNSASDDVNGQRGGLQQGQQHPRPPPLPVRTNTSTSMIDEDDPEQDPDHHQHQQQQRQRSGSTLNGGDAYAGLSAFDLGSDGYSADTPAPRRDDLLF